MGGEGYKRWTCMGGNEQCTENKGEERRIYLLIYVIVDL